MNIIRLINDDTAYEKIRLHAGEVLFREGEQCRNVTVIMEGSVKISSFDRNGREIIYNHIDNVGIFGNNLIFSSSPFYKGDVMVLRDGFAAIIDREKLVFLLQNNEQFLTEYLKIQSDFTKTLNSRIKILSSLSAKERLFCLLQENGGSINYGNITQLAGDLNLTREATSRIVHKLEKENKIEIRGRTITYLQERE